MRYICILMSLLLTACTLPGADATEDDLAALLTLFQVQQTANQTTNWVSYAMIIDSSNSGGYTIASAPVTNSARWRRNGDSMEIRYEYAHTNNAGTANGTGYYVYRLPPGYSIDTGKVALNTTPAVAGGSVVGTGQVNASTISDLTVFPFNANGVVMQGSPIAGAASYF
ncbi:MAG: hypothetical protein KDK27_18565, partial [Leptospiraceae bacterium]|nr:hypothetical protein [Leptospiraceae bacterium]